MPRQGKPAKEPLATGDCAKAIASCERALAELSPDLRQLLEHTLHDLERPYLGARYTPRRSGLAERPSEVADCHGRARSTLYAQAQARMDLARLAGQAQSEYANYKTWLFSEGLKCADAVAKGVRDPTTKRLSVDAPVSVDAGTQRLAMLEAQPAPPHGHSSSPGSAATGTASDAGPLVPPSPEASAAVAGAVSAVGDGGVPGFVAEPKRTSPLVSSGDLHVGKNAHRATTGSLDAGPWSKGAGAVLVVGRSAFDAGPTSTDAGVPQMVGRDSLDAGLGASALLGTPLGTGLTANPQAVSVLDVWRALAADRVKLEADVDWASGFLASRELRDCRCSRVEPSQLVRRLEAKQPLEVDEPKAARCEACLQDAFPTWKTRVKKQCALMEQLTDYELGVLERSDDGNGLPPRCVALVRSKRGSFDAGARALQTQLAPAANGAFIITKGPDSTKAPLDVARPVDYAPMPAREEGRLYVRLFMSAPCVAEIDPGPMLARTGDLLPVPPGLKALTIRSACGGVAEVYWAKEEKPRRSEIFGANQPLRLEFQ